MIIKHSEFITSAVKPVHYPDPVFPEIAFAGRSNVGKSSLINIIINRKSLVKTSSTPGRTRLINFFKINKAFVFVDLPGYGYARVPAAVRKSWGPMIEKYLLTREALKGVVLIMDIRRIPGTEELQLINFLNYLSIPNIFILTKADKLSKTKQAKQHKAIAETLFIAQSNFIIFSAKTRLGKEAVLKSIENLII